LFEQYEVGEYFDEMFASRGMPRAHYAKLFETLAAMEPEQFEQRRKIADLAFLLQGITFTATAQARSGSSPST
jgi:uncharacterized circularly permuted ATP-grasp superfamily protein